MGSQLSLIGMSVVCWILMIAAVWYARWCEHKRDEADRKYQWLWETIHGDHKHCASCGDCLPVPFSLGMKEYICLGCH